MNERQVIGISFCSHSVYQVVRGQTIFLLVHVEYVSSPLQCSNFWFLLYPWISILCCLIYNEICT